MLNVVWCRKSLVPLHDQTIDQSSLSCASALLEESVRRALSHKYLESHFVARNRSAFGKSYYWGIQSPPVTPVVLMGSLRENTLWDSIENNLHHLLSSLYQYPSDFYHPFHVQDTKRLITHPLSINLSIYHFINDLITRNIEINFWCH